MHQDITGIILSGGKSTRMGQNKSFLKLGNKFIIDIVIDLMKPLFNDVLIITNEPELYSYISLKVYEDIYKEIGPIAGIHSGLSNSYTKKNFIISCDIPLMNSEMIESIIKQSKGYDITVVRADGYVQELCGIYDKSIIPTIENIIKSELSTEVRHEHQGKRKCKVHNLLHSCNSNIIENAKELNGYNTEIFLNMNTPEDFEIIQSVLQIKEQKLL